MIPSLDRRAVLACVAAAAVVTGGAALLSQSVPPPAARPGPEPGPDSKVQPGTPTGDVIKGEFAESKVYPGTWREYWVYIPKQLDRSKPAPVMVFQDGLQYNAPGGVRQPHSPEGRAADRRRVRHARPRQGAVLRRARPHEPQLRVRRGERRLRAVPHRRDAAVRREDARPQPVDGPERSRDRGKQQRRHRGVRGRVAAARRVPARVQRASAPTSGCAAATNSRC